jgi:hypothetical protein
MIYGRITSLFLIKGILLQDSSEDIMSQLRALIDLRIKGKAIKYFMEKCVRITPDPKDIVSKREMHGLGSVKIRA